MKSSCSLFFLLYGLLDIGHNWTTGSHTTPIQQHDRLTALTYLRRDIDSSDEGTSLVFISSAGVLWKTHQLLTEIHVGNTDSWNNPKAVMKYMCIFITHVCPGTFVRIVPKPLIQHLRNNTAPNKRLSVSLNLAQRCTCKARSSEATDRFFSFSLRYAN